MLKELKQTNKQKFKKEKKKTENDIWTKWEYQQRESIKNENHKFSIWEI